MNFSINLLLLTLSLGSLIVQPLLLPSLLTKLNFNLKLDYASFWVILHASKVTSCMIFNPSKYLSPEMLFFMKTFSLFTLWFLQIGWLTLFLTLFCLIHFLKLPLFLHLHFLLIIFLKIIMMLVILLNLLFLISQILITSMIMLLLENPQDPLNLLLISEIFIATYYVIRRYQLVILHILYPITCPTILCLLLTCLLL